MTWIADRNGWPEWVETGGPRFPRWWVVIVAAVIMVVAAL